MERQLKLILSVFCVLGVVQARRTYAHPERLETHGGMGQIASYTISPNGEKVALIEIRNARSGERMRLVVMGLRRPTTPDRTILVGTGIGSVYWIDNKEILFIRQKRRCDVVVENIETGVRHVVFASRHRISLVAFERGRGLLAYDYTDYWRWNHRVSVRMKDSMTTLQLIEPPWAEWTGSEYIGALQIDPARVGDPAKRIRLAKNRFQFPVSVIWRSGRLLAVVSSMRSLRSRIYDLESGARIERAMPLFRVFGFAASESGEMAVISTRIEKRLSRVQCGCDGSLNAFVLGGSGRAQRIGAVRKGGFLEEVSRVWWGKQGDLIAQVRGFRGNGGADRWWLEEVNANRDRLVRRFYWPGGDLGGARHPCSVDAARSRAICIGQTLTMPPVLVEVNLTDGAMRVLRRLNPSQHRLKFTFRKVRIPNCFGFHSTAFLALPSGADTHSVPLAVMAYGFSEAYSRDAQWITSYPVAKFVHAGIAVLLLNWARVGARNLSPFSVSKRDLESAVSLFANAIPAVRASGVRVSRAMLLGWSFGGLFAAHAIQSIHGYVAAQVGDPADYNVAAYALGNDLWRGQSRVFFGGPPVGRYLSRYQFVDPVGNGRAPAAPILLEFVSRNPDVGQLLEEWRGVGAEVEAFAYRRSIHWLNVPGEARISRLRNLYWARLNLFGPQSVSQAALRRVGLTIPAKGWWSGKSVQAQGVSSVANSRCRARCGSRLLQRCRQTVGESEAR